jgi:hypothetical protein
MAATDNQGSANDEGRRHPDGSPCLEGTKSVPEGYVPCCQDFDYGTTRCAYDVRYEYWKENNEWVIVIVEAAGGGGVLISYCPHCGAPLKGAEPR